MKKKIAIVTGVLLGMFLIYNALWFVNYKKYTGLGEKIDPSEQNNDYSMEKDGYTFAVFKPEYLSFKGNLSVSKNMLFSEDVKEADGIDLIIWPCFTGGYEVGVMIYHNTAVESEDASTIQINSESIELELDKDGKLQTEYRYLEKEYLEHKDEINKLLEICEEVWKINLPH